MLFTLLLLILDDSHEPLKFIILFVSLIIFVIKYLKTRPTLTPNLTEWLLFNPNSAIFQLYYGKNKLSFNEMMMRPTL